ncbi:hypothetical protein WJX73_001750 [Symbiochloris irregularis]|uniref:ORC1/DEAH AAA+ ATPase domain-containing protein n=1 Tax=Symbiochloris irregularis TaxID=706552 RepID=A0AAW1PFC4_9CHLO
MNAMWLAEPSQWLKSGLRIGAGLTIGSLAYSRVRHHLVYRRLLHGHCPCDWSATACSKVYVHRPEEESAVARIIRPAKDSPGSAMFFYIVGSSGCGKSTCVQWVCNQERSGCIYVTAHRKSNDFAGRLQDALLMLDNLPNPVRLIYDVALRIGHESAVEDAASSKLVACCQALKEAAEGYRRKCGRPAVLIIDSAELLAGQPALEELLEASRGWADQGLVRLVLVTSEDSFVKRLLDNTRCSVSGSHEVEDLNSGQALAFLQRRGLDGKACHELVNHAGGRCIELVAAVESLHNGQSMEDVKQLILSAAERLYQEAGLLDDTIHRKAGLRVVDALLRSPDRTVDFATWNRLVPNPKDKEALLSSNVFSMQHKHRRIGFDSRSVERYAQLHLKDVALSDAHCDCCA